MKTIDDVLERLDGEGCAMVVQLSAAECREMAAIIRDEPGGLVASAMRRIASIHAARSRSSHLDLNSAGGGDP